MSKIMDSWRKAPQNSDEARKGEVEQLVSAIDGSLDAVDTISSCSSHMRRIIDDILTLSKLDANLLKISPSLVSTGRLLQDVRKMFEVEAERNGVSFKAQIGTTAKQLKADWMVIDPGRVTQVLVRVDISPRRPCIDCKTD